MNLEGRRILTERLNDQELAHVAPFLERHRRVEFRDIRIRETVEKHFAGMSMTAATKALAAELVSRGSRGTPLGDKVAVILALNGGRPLHEKRLQQIVGDEGPRTKWAKCARPIASNRAPAAGSQNEN